MSDPKPAATNEIAVYTAIFGCKDKLQEQPQFPGVDYICFTDAKIHRTRTWQLVIDAPNHTDPRRSAKIYKILPHRYLSQYKYSIWIDGNWVLRRNPWELVEQYLTETPIAVFRHPARASVYAEAEECIRRQKDTVATIQAQMARYQALQYPDAALAACTVLVRQHGHKVLMAAMETWWSEIVHASVRDQLSFNFALEQQGLPYATLPGELYANDYFQPTQHLFMQHTPDRLTRQLACLVLWLSYRLPFAERLIQRTSATLRQWRHSATSQSR